MSYLCVSTVSDTHHGSFIAALFERTLTRNEELEARVEELERELLVWKEAFKTADGDRKVLNKAVLKLERSLGALKVCFHHLVCPGIGADGAPLPSPIYTHTTVAPRYPGRQPFDSLSDRR